MSGGKRIAGCTRVVALLIFIFCVPIFLDTLPITLCSGEAKDKMRKRGERAAESLSEALKSIPASRVASTLVPNMIFLAKEMMRQLLSDTAEEGQHREGLARVVADKEAKACADHVISVWRTAVEHCARVWPHMSGAFLRALLAEWRHCSRVGRRSRHQGDAEGVLWANWALECVGSRRRKEMSQVRFHQLQCNLHSADRESRVRNFCSKSDEVYLRLSSLDFDQVHLKSCKIKSISMYPLCNYDSHKIGPILTRTCYVEVCLIAELSLVKRAHVVCFL